MNNEKSNESIISFSFVMAGALAAYIMSTVLELLGGMFGVIARLRDIPAVHHGLPVSVGLAVFLYLFFNKVIHAWADEVVSEVSKVVWPTRKDVVSMTIVVCAMVVLSGVMLGVWDFFASQMIKLFVK